MYYFSVKCYCFCEYLCKLLGNDPLLKRYACSEGYGMRKSSVWEVVYMFSVYLDVAMTVIDAVIGYVIGDIQESLSDLIT